MKLSALSAQINSEEAIDIVLIESYKQYDTLWNEYSQYKFTPFNPTDKYTISYVRNQSTGKEMRLMKGAPQVGSRSSPSPSAHTQPHPDTCHWEPCTSSTHSRAHQMPFLRTRVEASSQLLSHLGELSPSSIGWLHLSSSQAEQDLFFQVPRHSASLSGSFMPCSIQPSSLPCSCSRSIGSSHIASGLLVLYLVAAHHAHALL